MAPAKSMRMERRILELKAAAASVFSNLKIDLLGTGHSFDIMLVMVLIRVECGTARGLFVRFGEFLDSPLLFEEDVTVDVVSDFD